MAKAPKPPVSTEITAGITTFFTMAYIVVVNPSILATEGTGMAFSGVLTATVLPSGLMTLFMGLYAKIPFAFLASIASVTAAAALLGKIDAPPSYFSMPTSARSSSSSTSSAPCGWRCCRRSSRCSSPTFSTRSRPSSGSRRPRAWSTGRATPSTCARAS